MVISTPTVSYNTPLVWYAHYIFYSVIPDITVTVKKVVQNPAVLAS